MLKLVTIRSCLNMSQSELAKELSVSPQFISAIENEKKKISPNLIYKMYNLNLINQAKRDKLLLDYYLIKVPNDLREKILNHF